MAGARRAAGARSRAGDEAGTPGLTRRSALALGAAAGLAALARGAVDPLAAIAAPSGFGLAVGRQSFDRHGLGPVLSAPRRFVVVGVREPGSLGAAIAVRTRRRGGPWSSWAPLHAAAGHAPDGAGAPRASEPLWTGPSDELQLRADRRPRRDVRLALVAVPVAAAALARARIAALPRAGAATLDGPPAIVPRSAWGGDSVKPRAAPSYGQVLVAVVHHTEQPGNTYTREQAPTYVLGIAKYHRDFNGWNDIGYNFLVDRFGTIYEGRAGGVDRPVVGAHALGFNSWSTGVSVLGNFMGEEAPPAVIDALGRLIAWKLPLHGSPVLGEVLVPHGAEGVLLERICGHRDVNQTDCPGDRLYPQLPAIRARAAELAGTPRLGPGVSLAAAARIVGYGEPVRLDGVVVAADRSPQAGAAVRIEKQGPSGAWKTMARTSAGADGRFTADVVWKRGALVRAVAEQGVSPPVPVSVKPLLELAAAEPTIALGERIALRGTMRPTGSLTVVVERRSGGRWRRERTVVRQVRRPAIALGITPRRIGTYRLRVTARSGKGVARLRAIPVRVTAR